MRRWSLRTQNVLELREPISKTGGPQRRLVRPPPPIATSRVSSIHENPCVRYWTAKGLSICAAVGTFVTPSTVNTGCCSEYTNTGGKPNRISFISAYNQIELPVFITTKPAPSRVSTLNLSLKRSEAATNYCF